MTGTLARLKASPRSSTLPPGPRALDRASTSDVNHRDTTSVCSQDEAWVPSSVTGPSTGGGMLPTRVKVVSTVQRARPKVPVSLRDPRKACCSAMPRSSVMGEASDVASVPRSSLSSCFDTTTEACSVNPAGKARTRNSCPSFAAPVSELIAVDCRPISEGFPIHPVTGVPLNSTNR